MQPTLLELLGVPAPPEVEGTSLVRWIDGEGEDPPPVFGQSGIHQPPQAYVRHGRFKLVRFANPKEIERFGGALALYDLRTDPGETRNAIARYPREAERLRQELDAWLARTWHEPSRAAPPVQFDARERELLRQLGYAK